MKPAMDIRNIQQDMLLVRTVCLFVTQYFYKYDNRKRNLICGIRINDSVWCILAAGNLAIYFNAKYKRMALSCDASIFLK